MIFEGDDCEWALVTWFLSVMENGHIRIDLHMKLGSKFKFLYHCGN
jgi:hypothetical protein